MVKFPNAKINIGLNILSKRSDGFHNISSCFYPIPFSDILEIVKADDFQFNSSGIEIPGDENLCIKAFELIKKDHAIGNVKIHLHKIIPIGAGLGGGSSNATFTLIMLSDLFSLELSDRQLENYAAKLGSDCPFFVKNQPVMASGTGTDLTSLNFSLTGKYLVLLSPGIHVSTAEAYSGVTPKINHDKLENTIAQEPLSEWKNCIINDFEESVFALYPDIQEAKNELYEAGATYVSMTGSGSAIYAIFNKKPELEIKISKICWQGFLE